MAEGSGARGGTGSPDVAGALGGTGAPTLRFRAACALVLTLLSTLAACTDSTAPPTPAGVTLEGGGGQEGEVGLSLPQPIVFEVRDAAGNPIAGAGVSLQVSEGGGSVAPASGTTGPEGRIQAIWTLGTDASKLQRLTALAGNASAQTTAVARPGSPAQLVVLDGDGQTGLAGVGLPDSLSVRVFDGYGNPVPNALVTWLVQEGSGAIAPIQVNAGADGRARARWTLGGSAGAHGAEARVGTALAVPFQATALPNAGIAGTIDLLGAFLSPPAQMALGEFSVGGSVFEGSGALRSPGGVRAGLVSMGDGGGPLPPRSAGTAQEEVVPGAWVVTLQAGAVSAPSGGLGRLSTAGARSMDREIRSMVSAFPSFAEARATVTGVSPVLRAIRIEVDPGASEGAVIASLRADPRVESVEPVRIFRSHALPRPHPLVASTLHAPAAATPASLASSFLDGTFFPRQSWHYGMISVPRAWELTEGNASVIVAVVDDGIRFDHVSLTSVLTNDGYDFVQEPAVLPNHCLGGTISLTGDGDGPDPNPTIPASYSYNPGGNCYFGPETFGGHGLHVAGTIAAAGAGVAGVAPRVRIRPIRVLGTTGQGTGYDVAQGILYAAGLPAEVGVGVYVQAPSAARVINLSLGGPGNDPTVAAAVTAASNAGVLLVASAGNSGNTIPHYPAALPQTISVSAVGPDQIRAPYSTFGSTVDLTAPGGNFYNAPSWYSPFGGGIWSALWNFDANESYLSPLQGTSMAAPHVSGVAALLFSHDPGLSAAAARNRLFQTARDLGPPGKDGEFGHGLVDALLALTNGAGLPSTLRASLFDAATGVKVAETVAEPDRSFQFSGLSEGSYLVYAGGDDRNDGVTGRPGFLWGARGGSALPTAVTVTGHGIQDGSLTTGFPVEQEPNNTMGTANFLPVGGYLFGTIGAIGEVDHFRVTIGAAGTYTFETGGVTALCGFGLEADTHLALLAHDGTVLAQHDNLNEATERYCARISIPLAPGTYFLRVRGAASSTGSYSVRAY